MYPAIVNIYIGIYIQTFRMKGNYDDFGRKS